MVQRAQYTHDDQLDIVSAPLSSSEAAALPQAGLGERLLLEPILLKSPAALILADEPTAALDTERGTKVMAMLRWHARKGSRWHDL